MAKMVCTLKSYPRSLAEKITAAMSDSGLYDTLYDGIVDLLMSEDSVTEHLDLYEN